MAGGGFSSSKSSPVDMTPQAYKNLQSPFASVLSNLLGFGGGASTATAGTRAATTNTGQSVGGSNANTRVVNGRIQTRQSVHNPAANGTDAASLRWVDSGPANSSTMAGGSATGGAPTDPLSGIPQYQGPLTAGLGANEQTLLNKLMQQGSNPNGGTGSAASNYLLDAIHGDYLNSNPFLDAAIKAAQRPTLEGLTETLTRDLPGRFTQAGQFVQPQGSSAFDRAAAIATRGAANANADIATNMSYSNYNDERGRQQDAALAQPGVTKQEMDNTVTNLQAQALPRLIQQAGIDKGVELFQDRMKNLLAVLGVTASVTQPTISQQSKSSSVQKPSIF